MNLVEKLTTEIERVSAIRNRYAGYERDLVIAYDRDGGPRGSVVPAIMMMTMDIDIAKRALAEDDAIACLAALKELEGYSSDD
jgi:hypothetical protein